VLEHKSSNISEKYYGRPIGNRQRSSERYQCRPPTASCSPALVVRNPQNFNRYYISVTVKATDFKFGWYIQRVHPNKSPFKILEKRDRGRIQGLSKFVGYPLLSQERVKLRTSNFVHTFTASIGTKAH